MDAINAALNDWRSLNKVLHTFREDQVKQMLDLEVVGQRRISVIERLHQRYNKLRVSRERVEFMKEGVTL
jgi:hypothetical protein